MAFPSLVFSLLLLSLVMLLTSAVPALAQTQINNLISIKGTLYFLAADVGHGRELWKTDGTTSGTKLVKDVTQGDEGSNLANFTDVNGTLFFSVTNHAADNFELWKSDGTEAGTVKVKDIPLGVAATGFYPRVGISFAAVGNTLFFTGNNSGSAYELWRSDGTPEGTTSIKAFAACGPSEAGYYAGPNFSNVNGTLFFSAGAGSTIDCELWQSNGTAAGTTLVKDINPGSGGSSPANFTNLDGTLYFTADDGVHGLELWKSNGTAVTTMLVQDLIPGIASSYPSNLTVMDGNLYFTAIIREYDIKTLWKMNGSSQQVEPLKTFSFIYYEGTEDGFEEGLDVGNFTVAGNFLYFSTMDVEFVSTLWKTDGTSEGTLALKDFDDFISSRRLSNFINVDGTLFFSIADARFHDEVWKSDGTVNGTQSVESGKFHSLTEMNDTLYFVKSSLDYYYNGRPEELWPDELWRSDGTQEGTVLVYKGPHVVRLTLVNDDTSEDILHLFSEERDPLEAPHYTIDYAQLPTHNLSIRATTVGETGSVVFKLNLEQVQIENHLPYAIAGDDPQGDYNPWALPVGTHILEAIPYSRTWGKGLAGTGLTVVLTVTGHKVTGFTLVNADTEEDLGALENGAVIDLSALPTQNLNIRADVFPAAIGSVVFSLDQTPRVIENHAPFSLFANDGNAYKAGVLPVGSHTLVATPYANSWGKGMQGEELSIAFRVISGSHASQENALMDPMQEASVNVSPNPIQGQATVAFSVPEAGRVVVEVYDMRGALVARLHDDEAKAGVSYAVELNGGKLQPGFYLCRLISGQQVQTRKVVVTR